MNSTGYATLTMKPAVSCRPVVWTDVAKFFILNYGLHAFTIISRPGAGVLVTIIDGLTAILIPFCGIRYAIVQISKFPMAQGSNGLAMARDARALCMVVPTSVNFGWEISPSLITIHGHQPIHGFSLFDWIKERVRYQSQTSEDTAQVLLSEGGIQINASDYKIVRVPDGFPVKPLPMVCCHNGCKMEIASNYSFLKTSAAIIQILYGSYELYAAVRRSDQLGRWGYAAYSLTVIPYVLMSFLNGLASLAAPSYPNMYLVFYNGYHETCAQDDVIAKGDLMSSNQDIPYEGGGSTTAPKHELEQERVLESVDAGAENSKSRSTDDLTTAQMDLIHGVRGAVIGAVGSTWGIPKPNKAPRRFSAGFTLLILFSLAAPHIIIHILSGHKSGQSTYTQRAWITSSLVLNQVIWTLPWLIPVLRGILVPELLVVRVPEDGGGIWIRVRVWMQRPENALLGLSLYTVAMSAPTIGSFVLVIQMMLQDQICVGE